MCRSCVKSVVHHLFVYGDGRAFGVKAWTASPENHVYIVYHTVEFAIACPPKLPTIRLGV
ncbi:hypothetical protein K469DRAFT_702500 [Zopfia rhizophila CBS 207.26]|uniref:Uncharacterized protein n=1 Tax=Zopfia rhizophila CBS 207.26 TaxID=1314779 RepID=A0A6A6EF63_9PEZI|nr:hypothetical protein K469DRAFT_702500 [Zopfia rhizophila CBS 207.26]